MTYIHMSDVVVCPSLSMLPISSMMMSSRLGGSVNVDVADQSNVGL